MNIHFSFGGVVVIVAPDVSATMRRTQGLSPRIEKREIIMKLNRLLLIGLLAAGLAQPAMAAKKPAKCVPAAW